MIGNDWLNHSGTIAELWLFFSSNRSRSAICMKINHFNQQGHQIHHKVSRILKLQIYDLFCEIEFVYLFLKNHHIFYTFNKGQKSTEVIVFVFYSNT